MHTDVSPARRDGRAPSATRRTGARPVALIVNGQTRTIDVEPRVSLLDALREHMGLTGSKKAATRGRAAPARCGSTAGACSRA